MRIRSSPPPVRSTRHRHAGNHCQRSPYVDSSLPSNALGSQTTLSAERHQPLRLRALRLSAVTGTITAATLRLHTQTATTSRAPPAAPFARYWQTRGRRRRHLQQPSVDQRHHGGYVRIRRPQCLVPDERASRSWTGRVINLSITSSNTDGAYYDSRETEPTRPTGIDIDTPPRIPSPDSDRRTYVENGTAAGTNFGTTTSLVADNSPCAKHSPLRSAVGRDAYVGQAASPRRQQFERPSPAGGAVRRSQWQLGRNDDHLQQSADRGHDRRHIRRGEPEHLGRDQCHQCRVGGALLELALT